MKNSFKNVLYNAFGFVFPIIIALFTTPYIVHKLTPEIYGIYVLAISLMGLMSFLDLGFGQGVIKFVSHYEARQDYDKINKVIGAILLINSLMGLIGAVIIYLFSPIFVTLFKINPIQYDIAVSSFKLISIGFFITLLSGVFSNIPKAVQRYDVAVKIQNTVWFMSVLSTVILLYLGKGLVDILIFYILFQFLGLLLYFHSSKKLLPNIKFSIHFEMETFKEIFGFSVFTAINSITGNIVFRVDKMIISALLGTEAVAYYSIPFMIAQIANGFVSSVSQFLFPTVSYVNSLVDKDKLNQIYHKSTRYIITMCLVIASCLILLGDTFLFFWMGKNFAEKSSYLLPIISVVYFFISSSVVGYYFYNGLGHSKVNMISSFVGATCYLLASALLIPKFGLRGAAMSFAFTLIPFPVYFYILNCLIRVDNKWFISIIIKSIIFIFIILFLKSFIIIPPSVGWLLLTGLSVIVLSLFVLYLLKILSVNDFLELKTKWEHIWVKA